MSDCIVLKQSAPRVEDLGHQDLDLCKSKILRKLWLCQVVASDEHFRDHSYVLFKWSELFIKVNFNDYVLYLSRSQYVQKNTLKNFHILFC